MNYTITHFSWRDGKPGLFMRAELTFESGIVMPVYVCSRAWKGGPHLPERMPGGGTNSLHTNARGRFRITTLRSFDKVVSGCANWIHRDENADTLIDDLVNDVENQRANHTQNVLGTITAIAGTTGPIRSS